MYNDSSICQIAGCCLSIPNPPFLTQLYDAGLGFCNHISPFPAVLLCQVLPIGGLQRDCKVRGGKRDLLLLVSFAFSACFPCPPALLLCPSSSSSLPEQQLNPVHIFSRSCRSSPVCKPSETPAPTAQCPCFRNQGTSFELRDTSTS